MNIFLRILKRVRFRKSISYDESKNVVDGMAKAKELYKELSIKTHPDRNPNNREIAEELMQRIVANRFNYSILLLLKKEVEEKLN